MKVEGNQRRANRSRRARRAVLTAFGALALLPLLPTTATFQDHDRRADAGFDKAGRLARLLTEAALHAPTAEASTGDDAGRGRLAFSPPVGYGMRVAAAPTQIVPPPRESVKGGRLFKPAPETPVEVSMLQRLNPMADESVRAAFASVSPGTIQTVAVAAAEGFSLKAKETLTGAGREEGTQVASLGAAVEGTNALGYATPDAGSRANSLFENVLRETPEAFVPPIGPKDHLWAATPLPADALSVKEQLCLANGIYFEARGESEEGQAAVAQVILNRVRNPVYPKTICGVVYQNKNWRNRCQFSFACDGKPDRIRDVKAFATAKRIAGAVTRGETWLAEVGSSTHYHANYVHPRWANAMEKLDRIGKHIFYRTYNGGL